MANIWEDLLRKQGASPEFAEQRQSDDFLSQLLQGAPPISPEQANIDLYNKNLKRLQAPSPFERVDAPAAMPELIAERAEADTQAAIRQEKEKPIDALKDQINILKARGNPADQAEIARLQGLIEKARGPQPLPELKGQPVEPSGMGDSLASRSGDEEIQDEARDLASSNEPAVDDTFRKEEAIATAQASLPPPEPQVNPLAAAQAKSDNLGALLMMARAGEKLGTSIARVKSDPNYLKEMEGMINKPVEDVLNQQKYATGQLDQKTKEFNYAFAKDKDDPKSAASVFYRDTLKEFAKNAKMNINVPDNLSAMEMEKIYPNIVNLVNAQEARETKAAVAAAGNETKKDKEVDKLAKSFKDDLDPSKSTRGLMAFNQRKVEQAEALEQLYTEKGGVLRNLDDRQTHELAIGLNNLLTSGNTGSVTQTMALVPRTARGNVKKMIEWITNDPQGNDQIKFVARMTETVEREKLLRQEQIKRAQVQRLNAHKRYKELDPEGYAAQLNAYGIDPTDVNEKGQYVPKTAHGGETYTPAQEAGIKSVMEANNIERDAAIKALKNAGKL